MRIRGKSRGKRRKVFKEELKKQGERSSGGRSEERGWVSMLSHPRNHARPQNERTEEHLKLRRGGLEKKKISEKKKQEIKGGVIRTPRLSS